MREYLISGKEPRSVRSFFNCNTDLLVRMVYWSLLPLLLTIAQLASTHNCNMEVNNRKAAGKPWYAGKPVRRSIYSCLSSSQNCAYSVHVVGMYEADSRHTAYHHPTRAAELFLNVSAGTGDRPLVLVLSTHEPVQWTLHIPEDVVVSKVILSSTLNSSVVFHKSRVLKVENNLRLYGYGSDRGGGMTQRLLDVLSRRLGPIASFTGTYLASKWVLNINRTLSPKSAHCEEEQSSEASTTQDMSYSLHYSLISFVILLLAIIVVAFAVLIGVLCIQALKFLHRRPSMNPKAYQVLNDRNSISTKLEFPLPKYHEILSV